MTLLVHCLNMFAITLQNSQVLGLCVSQSKDMPPQWSNGKVMTNPEYSVVKKWVLKQRTRRHPTWGANVPVRRELFLTKRKTVATLRSAHGRGGRGGHGRGAEGITIHPTIATLWREGITIQSFWTEEITSASSSKLVKA